jgi:ABC-type branched-subunit amino acid transport system permease subunit
LRWARAGGLALLAVLAWLLPYQLNVYWISVADIAILFALLSVGMGLVMGVAGQVNLAQIAFFGVGAYTTAILTTHDGYGFWTAAVLAMIATALAGVVVGTPALRVQSHYLRLGHLRDPHAAAVRHQPVEPVPLLLPGTHRAGRRAGIRALHRPHAARPPDAGDAG